LILIQAQIMAEFVEEGNANLLPKNFGISLSVVPKAIQEQADLR
jgi:hypothetical protein